MKKKKSEKLKKNKEKLQLKDTFLILKINERKAFLKAWLKKQ